MTFIRQLACPGKDCAAPAKLGFRQLHFTGEFMQVPDCRGENFPEARIADPLQFAQNRFSDLFLVFDNHSRRQISKYGCSKENMMLSFFRIIYEPEKGTFEKQP